MTKGIDVSHWQGDIDWSKVRADGYEFAIIKLTEGTTFIDPKGAENVKQAKAHGLKVYGYHYAHINSVVVARKEAAHFKRVADGLGLDGAALDIEYRGADGNLTEPSLAFLDAISDVGKETYFYSYPYFIDQHFDERITKYPLWIAHYGVDEPRIAPWDDYAIWQFSSQGDVAGIRENCDVNIMKVEIQKKPHSTNLLRKGDEGKVVKELQENLLAVGEKLPRYGADGKFGNETKEAVMSFQTRRGIQVDGIVGPVTRRELAEALKTNTYTIKSGDTFWELEEQHGWSHGTLQKLNPNVDPRRLQVGQEIVTP